MGDGAGEAGVPSIIVRPAEVHHRVENRNLAQISLHECRRAEFR